MTVDVLANEVAITGPDGVAVSLTGEAAEESSRRLAKAARTIAEGRGDRRNGTEDGLLDDKN